MECIFFLLWAMAHPPQGLTMAALHSKIPVTSSRILKILTIGEHKMNYDIKQSGERIRQLRIHRGYTQEMLAQELSIDRSFLSHVEAGKKGCSVDLLVQFASIFGVSIDYLVLGTVHRGSSEPIDAERLREGIEKLICHLEEFERKL